MRSPRAATATMPARVLVNAMFWTIVVYFIWHSLHARVEANWFAPVYPAFAVAAAVAAHLAPWEPRWQRVADFCRRWARAVRRRDVRASDRAGQYRCAVGLSPRCHGAQRRRRLARTGCRDRGGAGTRRRALACWRRITAPPAGSRSICRRARASRSRASASDGSTCPSRTAAQLGGKLLYVHEVWPERSPVEARICSRREGRRRSRASAARL